MHNLVLQSYGDEVQYRRAILTVLSFCACVGDSLKKYRIFLFTDNIPYFKNYFADFEINYLPLDEARISEWMGERHFLHRMKIALIAEVFKIADGHLLYVDTDCFFTGDPTHRMENLDPQSSGMHKREYVFDQLSNLPLLAGMESRTFYAGVIGQEFLLPGGGKIEIKSSLSSWNAGILLLHKEHASYLTEVFSLTDQFYRLTGNHASEQFAFSQRPSFHRRRCLL